MVSKHATKFCNHFPKTYTQYRKEQHRFGTYLRYGEALRKPEHPPVKSLGQEHKIHGINDC